MQKSPSIAADATFMARGAEFGQKSAVEPLDLVEVWDAEPLRATLRPAASKISISAKLSRPKSVPEPTRDVMPRTVTKRTARSTSARGQGELSSPGSGATVAARPPGAVTPPSQCTLAEKVDAGAAALLRP